MTIVLTPIYFLMYIEVLDYLYCTVYFDLTILALLVGRDEKMINSFTNPTRKGINQISHNTPFKLIFDDPLASYQLIEYYRLSFQLV